MLGLPVIPYRSFEDDVVLGVQTAGGGTGALRLGMEFLVKQLGYKRYHCSAQTWDTHPNIFKVRRVH